jgi:hypothetical protein
MMRLRSGRLVSPSNCLLMMTVTCRVSRACITGCRLVNDLRSSLGERVPTACIGISSLAACVFAAWCSTSALCCPVPLAAAAAAAGTPQINKDSGVGHEVWPDATGVFTRKECTVLGGVFARESKQSMVLRWEHASDVQSLLVRHKFEELKETLAQSFATITPAGATDSQESGQEAGAGAGAAAAVGGATSAESAPKPEPFDEDIVSSGVPMVGTVEWPELDARSPVYGFLRDADKAFVAFVGDLVLGSSDTLKWVRGLRMVGRLDGSTVTGSWLSVASAPPAVPLKVRPPLDYFLACLLACVLALLC